MTAKNVLLEKGWRVPCEWRTPEGAVLLRRGASWRFQWSLLAFLLLLAAGLAVIAGNLGVWIVHRVEVLLVLGGIGCWRWSWAATQSVRAML
jgi:hypothetical protein